MPNLALDLEVDRVDLVNEGANSEAFIRLYKRKEHNTMDLQEIIAKMKPEHAEVVTAAIEKAKAEVPEATSEELAKAKETVESLTAQLTETVNKTKVGPTEEEVIKSLDPAVQEIFKGLQAQKAAAEQLAKTLNDEKIKEEAIAKAKELKNIPVAEDKLVEVVKSITPEHYEVLKAANDAIEKGLLTPVGTEGSNEVVAKTAAWAKIEKKAEEIAMKESISKEKAIGRVIVENSKLYDEYLKGGN